MKKLIPAICLLALSGISQAAFSDDDDDRDGKATICHKGKTVVINERGIPGHRGHGDNVEGACGSVPSAPDTMAAVVMMHCEGEGEPSIIKSPAELVVETAGKNCADVLAELLDADYMLRAATANTDYLLIGEVEESESSDD